VVNSDSTAAETTKVSGCLQDGMTVDVVELGSEESKGEEMEGEEVE
jgi:hypothetical protein